MQTPDGGYVMSGLWGGGAGDVYLVKTDVSGNSGCNQLSDATVVTSPPTLTSKTGTIISYGSIVKSTVAVVSFGATVSSQCTTTGTNEIKTSDLISVYPNPTSVSLNVHVPSNSVVNQMQITDITGRVLLADNSQQKTDVYSINVSSLSHGVYFISINSKDGSEVKKFIKE